jgi:hypothetical protein
MRHGFIGLMANAIVVVVLIAFVSGKVGPEPRADGLTVGREVLVQKEEDWAPATIFQVDGERVYVRYTTGSREYAWVSTKNMKLPNGDLHAPAARR